MVMNQSHLVEVWPLIRQKEWNMLAFTLSSPKYNSPIVPEMNKPGRLEPSIELFWSFLLGCKSA